MFLRPEALVPSPTPATNPATRKSGALLPHSLAHQPVQNIEAIQTLPFMSFSLAASNSRPEPAVAVRAVAERALGFFRCSPLRCQDEIRLALPASGSAGARAMSDARWRQGLGRAVRFSERQFQAWALDQREQGRTQTNRRKSSRS
jgi:hypothetical protein